MLDHVGSSLPDRLENFDFIATHHPFESLKSAQGEKIFVTTLRNPIRRLISLFRFWKSVSSDHALSIADGRVMMIKSLSLEEFLLKAPSDLLPYIDNEMTRHFSCASETVTEEDYRVAVKNLEACSEIFLQESLNEDVGNFFTKIGCENRFSLGRINVTDENHKVDSRTFEPAESIQLKDLSQAAVDALVRHTHFDRMLYDTAVKLREEKKYQRSHKLDELNILRPALIRGELIAPSSDPAFSGMLAGGWAPFEGVLWSVGRRAALKFRITGAKLDNSKLTVRFSACVLANRDYLSVVVRCNDQVPRKILFINNDIVLDNISELLSDHSSVCTGNSVAELEFTSDSGLNIKSINSIIFEISEISSPSRLKFNDDARELGVNLLSLKLS